ncbi:hypothetical protein JYG30_04900 [Fibrella sp. USSR17]
MNRYTKNGTVAFLIRLLLVALLGNSYAYAQLTASNVCPATTVDLTTHQADTPPPGAQITWHTGTPASLANKVLNPTTVGAGVYYAAYYDIAGNCYSATSEPLTVSIIPCAPINNVCPSNTVDLTALLYSAPSTGTLITWHTGTPASQANQVSNPTSVTTGTYYAAYYDVAGNCYGNTTAPITVVTTPCPTPLPDNGVVAAGFSSTAVADVTANDLIGGQPVVLGSGGNATIAVVGSYPAGITLNTTTGAVTVAPTTAPGTYTAVYQLCNVATSPSCETALVTVTVNPSSIANNDAGLASAGTGGTAIPTVTTNDLINGLPVILGNTGNATVASVGTYPAGITLDPATGSISVATGTAPGTYTLVYQLCVKLSPATCSTALAIVTVSPSVIAVDDAGLASAGAGGTAIPNVATNDIINGVPAVLGLNAEVSPVGTYPSGITLNTNTGSISVATGTVPGTYTLVYRICDKLSPVTCATATAIVLVSPSVIANDDAGAGSAGASGVAIGSLVANDVVNGLPATLGATGNAVVAAVGTYPAGITLDANTGSISVAIGTVPGTYTLVYQLCDKLSPVTCATANAVVTVEPSVIAMDDAGLASAGTGGTAIPNVTGNDIVNGVSVMLGVNAEVSTVGTYPAGITLNTTTGSISVATGTVPGTYTLVYQLCDKLAAPTCTTATAIVLVSPSVIALNDSGTASAGTGGTAITNVVANDQVNGLPATLGGTGNATVASVGTYPSGITLDPNTGSISVAIGTVPGTYTLVYQLCDKLSPVTCATANAIVTVTPSVITVNDSGTASAGTGGTAIADVTDNDEVNGLPVVLGPAGNAVVAAVGTYPAGITLDTNTGSVSVAIGTVPGTYTLVYQLCDKLSSPTCATALAIVTVSPSVIAVDDAGLASAGAGGIAIPNVATNDIVNGIPATLGNAGNAVVSAVGTYPAGITLDTNTGSINVATGTMPGTYTLVYQLCDKLSPMTCATANAIITISPSVIANGDDGTGSAGASGIVIADVTDNDFVNGAPAVLGVNATVASVGTYPVGITLNATTGSISVAAGTAPGTYTLVYQLCDKLSSPTCTTATAIVIVSPSVLAVNDSGTASAGTGGTAIADVTANDFVNGVPAALGITGNAVVATVGTYPAGITLDTNTGSISVAIGTTPGTYTMVYQLCDKLSPVACATAKAVVTVTPSINTVSDSGTASAGTGGTAITNVATNDVVNGLPAALGINAEVASLGTYPAGITFNTTTGSISVAIGTVPGTYTLVYQLCDKLSPVTCATANVFITVSPSVIANDDAGTGSAGADGIVIPSLVANDMVNGLPATLGNAGNAVVSAVGTYSSGITLDTNTGSISVATGTVPGTYTLIYQLCDKLSPVTCTTANAVVTVTPSVIAVNDSGTASAGTGGTAIADVTDNDEVNGLPVVLGPSGNAVVAAVGTYPAGITLDTNTGSVSVAIGTVPGTYTLVYQLCDKLSPVTCATANAFVTVLPSVIAVNDSGTASTGTGGLAVSDVTDNDVVNGVVATLGATGNATVASVGTYPSGITLDTNTGSISVAVGTVPGTYTLVYQLCDKLSPATCTTALAVVTVSPSVIAVNDAGLASAGTGGTAIADVTDNDEVNGLPVVPGVNATVASVGTYPAGITLDPATGSINVATGTAPGTYTLVYQLCDKLSPVTCATALAIVTVSPSVIAVDDAGLASAGAGGTAIPNVATNDIINGVPAVLGLNAEVSPVGTYPSGITLNTNTGSISVATGTVPGIYSLVYQICDKLTAPTCATATAIVIVSPSVIANDDAGTASAGTGGTAITNVVANDQVNGLPATLGGTGNATVASVGTYPSGIALDANTGSISVAIGTVPGTYTLVYQLCDKLSPVTCATANAVVTVTPSVIAVNDAGTALTGTGGAAIANVAANDEVNGVPATLGNTGNATIAAVGTYPAGITLNPTTGAVSIAVGTYPGTYTLVYQLCDKLSPVTCATALAIVTADGVMPTVLIDGPAPGSVVAVYTPVLSGTATPGSLVVLTGPVGVTLCSTTATSSGSFSCLSPVLTDGPQSVTAIAYNDGLVSEPSVTNFTVTVPPTLTILSPSDELVTVKNPPISGTATPGSSVTVIGGPGSTGGPCIVTVSASGTYACESLTFTNGVQSVTAIATSLAGVLSTPVVSTFTVAAPPSVTINDPVPGSVVATFTPTISGTATPNTVVVLTDATNATLCSTTATATGSWSCTVGPLANGPQSVTAIAYDNGVPSAPSVSSFTVAVPPTIAITDPVDGTTVYGLNPPVSGTATPFASVTVLGPNGQSCITTASVSGTFICTSLTFVDGPASITALASNAGGTSAPAISNFTVVGPPSLTVLSPVNILTTTTPTISGTATPGSAIVITGPGPVTLCTTTASASGTYACALTSPLPEGPTNLTVTAIGPGGSTSQPISFTTVGVPTIAILSPAEGGTATTTPTISGTATPMASVTVLGPDGQFCITTASVSGTFACANLTFVDGPASVTAIVSNVGGTSTDVTSFTAIKILVLKMKVMLQGALIGGTGGLMRDDLRSKGFLPSAEPYAAIGGVRFTHVNSGGEVMPASVTAQNAGTGDAVVDWVFVELRSPSNMSLVVATRSALVQRDGDVVLAIDGVSPLSFTGLTGNDFYVSVKHRNHLGAMTATAVPLSTTGTIVDFTTMTGAQLYNKVIGVYNFEGYEQRTESGKQALWAGDANHNGQVKYQGSMNDLVPIFTEVLGAQNTSNPVYNFDNALGYYFGDVNMDGKVKYQGTATDPSLVFTNILTYYLLNDARLYNFDFMIEQIP